MYDVPGFMIMKGAIMITDEEEDDDYTNTKQY